MPELFDRAVRIELVDTKELDFVTRVTVTNKTIISGLHVAFSVEKNLEKDPNTCECHITNLSEKTRAELQKRPLKLFVFAGYGDSLTQIFVGDIEWVESVREQTGWASKIIAADGSRAINNARINKSYSKGINISSIVKDVSGSMGLRMPQNASDAVELADQLVSGTAISGPSHRQLTQMLEAKGMKWSIQDDQLVILKSDETRANEARIVSVHTGMIGTPGFGSPPKKGESPMLTVSSLLYPEISPGIKIDLQSKTAKGIFRVERVRHNGDTHGESWSTDIEAKPV